MNSAVDRFRTRLADERGVALVMALLVVSAMSITAVAMSQLMASNETAFGRDRQELRALNAAEAGVNYAIGRLSQLSSASYGAGTTIGPTAFAVDGNSTGGSWTAVKGTVSGASTKWMVTSTAAVARVTRTVKVQVAAPQATTSTPASLAWSYGFFVADPTGCTTMVGSAQLTMPIFIGGNLCLTGTQSIVEPVAGLPTAQKKVTVYVRGYIQTGGSSSIGTSGAGNGVKSVLAVNGCKKSSGAAVICSQSSQSKVYADDYSPAPSTLTKPPIYPDATYAGGDWDQPVCTTGSFSFDNDGVRNTSRGTIDMLPATSYDCTVYTDATRTTEVGRLSWNSATRELAISGTIYLDGNLDFAGGAQATYSGFGTIYVDGTVTTNGNSAFCGPGATLAGDRCEGLWDGAQGAIAIIAVNHENAATTWLMNGTAEFNVLVYVVGTFSQSGDARVTGPVVTDRATVAGSTDHTDVLNPPPGTPGAAESVTGSSWGSVVPGSWQQCPATGAC